MDEHSLPVDYATSGERLLRLLDRAGPAPGAALWWWVDAADQWRFVLVPAADAPGERLRADAERALAELGSPFDPGLLDVLAPENELLTALGRKVQVSGISRVRLGRGSIDGVALPACLVYRLGLHGGVARRRSTDPAEHAEARRVRAEAKAARRQATLARRAASRARRSRGRPRRPTP